MEIKKLLSEKVKGIMPSATLAITAKAKELKQKGIDIVGFGAGEPDFDTPANIKNAAKVAIDDPAMAKYTESSGLPALKNTIAAKLKRDNSLIYEPSQIIISNGGKHTLANICMTLINPGDKVLLPSPYWLSYYEQIRFCGGKPIFVETDKNKDFQIDEKIISKKITERTKILILNSPNNPTGAIIEENILKKIAELCVKNNIIVVSDEVYEPFIYGGKKHTSIASFGKEIYDRTITVNAVSKTYSMVGWRVGYCAGPKEIIKAINNLQSHMTSNVCNVAQKAAIEALNGSQESIIKMRTEFNKRRKYMFERLNAMNRVKCNLPQGAFYCFPNISGTGLNSMDFSRRLLEEANVAVIPGIVFGDDNCIRLSYACSIETIKKGMNRMEEFCKNLKGYKND